MQFAMGIARLGALVDFISHTVVVGFTAGAGLLIIAGQLRNFFGVPVPSGTRFFEPLREFALRIATIDPWITATGAVTLVVAMAAKRFVPRIPYMVVAMIAGSVFAYALARGRHRQVPIVGTLPSAIPPLVAAVLRSRDMAASSSPPRWRSRCSA